MLRLSVPALDRFDPSAFAFVAAVMRENPKKRWFSADAVWEDYSFSYFAEYAGPNDEPLSRGQFFRQLKIAGIKRTRSGARNQVGKRPYVYKLVRRGRLKTEVGRFRDARLGSVSG